MGGSPGMYTDRQHAVHAASMGVAAPPDAAPARPALAATTMLGAGIAS
ncbi:MAG: hypothetical protein U0893_12070 [Chloroflexota bacterium]